MAAEKVSFEQFLESVDGEFHAFALELHDYLLNNGCKLAIVEQKSGYLAGYKFGKPPKAMTNFLFRKGRLLVRIYGENSSEYCDFLNTLPPEMVESIDGSGECKRLTQNGCSPKCSGYDFTIGDARFQKCRYNCFEFLVTAESVPFIRAFVESEINARMEMK